MVYSLSNRLVDIVVGAVIEYYGCNSGCRATASEVNLINTTSFWGDFDYLFLFTLLTKFLISCTVGYPSTWESPWCRVQCMCGSLVLKPHCDGDNSATKVTQTLEDQGESFHWVWNRPCSIAVHTWQLNFKNFSWQQCYASLWNCCLSQVGNVSWSPCDIYPKGSTRIGA